MTIESDGLRKGTITQNSIDRLAQKVLERYRFGAQRMNGVEVLYKDGFDLEAGDIVIFGGSNTQLIDPETGELMEQRLVEIVNKSINVKTGNIKFDLLNTAFDLDGRFGVIAPSSVIGTGATTTEIPLDASFGTGEFENEVDKWTNYVNQPILIHNEDYSTTESTTITGISTTKPNTLIVETLAGAPSAGFIVDFTEFDDTSTEAQDIIKQSHCFINPTVTVSSGTSGTEFVVTDASDLAIGQTVLVHSVDFTSLSPETTISDVVGTTITVADDLGFTPASGNLVELIGFLDGTPAYRFI